MQTITASILCRICSSNCSNQLSNLTLSENTRLSCKINCLNFIVHKRLYHKVFCATIVLDTCYHSRSFPKLQSTVLLEAWSIANSHRQIVHRTARWFGATTLALYKCGSLMTVLATWEVSYSMQSTVKCTRVYHMVLLYWSTPCLVVRWKLDQICPRKSILWWNKIRWHHVPVIISLFEISRVVMASSKNLSERLSELVSLDVMRLLIVLLVFC